MNGPRPAEAGRPALLDPVRDEARELDAGVRSQMERSLGARFGDVVVHAGTASSALADSFDAAAFTLGRHVVFGPGRFDPSSVRGRTLIAHELGHVVEQRRGGGDLDAGERMPAGVIPLHGGHADGAGRTAAQAALGHSVSVSGASSVGIARLTKAEERTSTPAAPAMREALVQPRRPATPAAPSLQLPSGNARTASRVVMQAIEGLTARPDGTFATSYQGQTLVMSAEDAEKARAAARNALVDAAARSRRRFEDAFGRYQAQEEVDEEFWLTSKAAHAAAWISSGGQHEDPGMALALQRPVVLLGEQNVQRMVGEGRLVSAAEEASRSELASGRSAALVRIYVDQTIEGAEAMATGLEYTRDAAFVTLGVLAVVATGGAAAGLAPGVIGTGVAGMSVGTTATVISVGAPIIANLGVGVVKLVEGDPVDWGDIAFDAAVQIVLARFGGKLGQSVFGKLAGNEVGRTVMRRVLASVGSGVISHEASQAFTVTVNETYKALRGRPVSWGQFLDELSTRMTDPKGIFMAAAMSGFQVAAHGAFDKAAAAKLAGSGGGGGSSKPPPPPAKPPAAPVQEPAPQVKTTAAPAAKPATAKPAPVQEPVSTKPAPFQAPVVPTKPAAKPVTEPTTVAKQAVAPTQKPATPPAPRAKTSAPAPVKPAKKPVTPSELKRRAEAGARMETKAVARAEKVAGQEAKATQKVTSSKARLDNAKKAVAAREQADRKPTKAQQGAVDRAKKAVAKSENRQVKAAEATQSAQKRAQSAGTEATKRAAAYAQAQKAALNKPPKATGVKPRFDPKKHGAFDPKKYRRPDLSTLKDQPAAVERIGADGMRKNPDARVSVFKDPFGSHVKPLAKGTKQQQGHDYERQARDDLTGGSKYRESHAAGDKTRHGDVGAYETKFKGSLSSDDLDQIWRDLNNPSRGNSALVITPKTTKGDLDKLAKLAAAFEKLTGTRPRIAVRETDPGGGTP